MFVKGETRNLNPSLLLNVKVGKGECVALRQLAKGPLKIMIHTNRTRYEAVFFTHPWLGTTLPVSKVKSYLINDKLPDKTDHRGSPYMVQAK